MDVEAEHSGGERTDGGSEGDELGSESDMQFVEELPETQVSPTYDQAAVYRQSLMTQVPGEGSVPAFASRPVRRGAGFALAKPRHPVEVSSSPPRSDEPDEYEYGTFIVRDEEEISYLTDRSSDI